MIAASSRNGSSKGVNMEKLFVYFKADDQELVCCNPFRVSSKKVAYVEAHFDLGENWTGYDSVRAIWRNTQNFAIIGTSSGVTFTVNNDGSIKLSGTATSASYFYLLQTTNGNVDEIRKYIKENTQYTLRPLSVSSKYFCQIILYGSGSTPTWAMTGSTFTTPSDLSLYRRLAIVIGAYNGAVLNDTIYPQLELGSTASDYEIFQGEMKNRQFVDELGNQLTVYGGQDEIIGGVLTVDRGMITDFSGLYYSQITKWTVAMPNADLVNIRAQTISSHYSRYIGGWASIPDGSFQAYNGIIGIADSNFHTAEEMRQHLIDNNVQFVYPLATPQTYQLSPQQINSLIGTNNVWADTGDVTVKYRADTKLYIDKVLAS